MDLPEQIAVLAAALAEGYIGWEDAHRWAEAWLAVEPTPSAIMDLFVTPPPPHRADWVMRLREKSPLPLSVDRQIQLLVVARQSGRLREPSGPGLIHSLREARGRRGTFDSLALAWEDGSLAEPNFWNDLMGLVTDEDEAGRAERGERAERLVSAFSDWDQSWGEGPAPPLSAAMHKIVAEWLADAGDMVALLPWLWGGVRGERKADAGSPSARAG